MKKTIIFISIIIAFALSACAKNISMEDSLIDDNNIVETTEKVTEKETEKVTEKETEKVTEKETEKATEKETEKVTEKATEKPTEKPTVVVPQETKPAHSHNFSKATCTEPEKCSCGETKGAVLGHQWSNATCTDVSKCTRCGEKKGTALGHQWASATCTDASKCTRCGEKKGVALGHSWKAASCSEAKSCTICGKKEGTALGHNYVEGVCSVCNGKDANYVKSYSVGETWTVDGQFEFRVNKVTITEKCNRYTNENRGYTNEQAILIDYTYKNIGVDAEKFLHSDGLYVSSVSFKVYDEDGEGADEYGTCTHSKRPKYCVIGTKCTASECYVLKNNSSKVMLVVSIKVDGKNESATFYLDIQ